MLIVEEFEDEFYGAAFQVLGHELEPAPHSSHARTHARAHARTHAQTLGHVMSC